MSFKSSTILKDESVDYSVDESSGPLCIKLTIGGNFYGNLDFRGCLVMVLLLFILMAGLPSMVTFMQRGLGWKTLVYTYSSP